MSDQIRVAVRVRPFNQREKDRDPKCIIRMEGKTTFITNPEDQVEKPFTFDYSYNSFVGRDDPSYASQTTVWQDIGEDVLNQAWQGFNFSLFAYGQTGSGKSYSMMGYGPDKGVIPIASEKIFERIAAAKASATDSDTTYKVEASMMEIYKEEVRDLFAPKAGALRVREGKSGFYVENLTRNAVADYDSISKLMDAGTKARTVAATNMNATSSRAHTIFAIVLTQTRIDRAKGTATDKTSVINLIDLAGSERAESTGATGDRLKEGASINLSLSCLGNVISALAHNSNPANAKKPQRVPYRDSVLTMLLQTSLGGNAKTVMIAALSPAEINYGETLSTLRYADRAKQIKNKAVVNEDPNETLIKSLKAEVEALRRALAAANGGAGIDALAPADAEAERERVRKEIEGELAAKIRAEIAGGWEAQLAETKARAEAREKELAELGLGSSGPDSDRSAQAARAKTTPHLSNLAEDSQLSGQVKYFLASSPASPNVSGGSTSISIGRRDPSLQPPNAIKLGGLSIQPRHAVITISSDGSDVSIAPATPGAKVYVNGSLVTLPTPLHHGHRILFGASHAYVMIHPAEADAGRLIDGCSSGAEASDTSAVASSSLTLEAIDHDYVLSEVHRAEAAAFTGISGAPANVDAESTAAEARLAQLRARAGTDVSASSDVARAEEELAALKRRKMREARQRSLLDERLLRVIPLVSEANAISDEMKRGVSFELKLMAAGGPGGGGRRGSVTSLDDISGGNSEVVAESDVFVRVAPSSPGTSRHPSSGTGAASAPSAPSAAPLIWHVDKFTNRLYLMREMYGCWSEGGGSLSGSSWSLPDRDPFCDPPEDTLIGRATIYLDSLQYGLQISERTPIIDMSGREQGELAVRITPHSADAPVPVPATMPGSSDVSGSSAGDVSGDECTLDVENLRELAGKRVGITVAVDAARGLPLTAGAGTSTAGGTYVRFTFFLDAQPTMTSVVSEASGGSRVNPEYRYRHTFTPLVTDELLRYVGSDALGCEVWTRAVNDGGAGGAKPDNGSASAADPCGIIEQQEGQQQVGKQQPSVGAMALAPPTTARLPTSPSDRGSSKQLQPPSPAPAFVAQSSAADATASVASTPAAAAATTVAAAATATVPNSGSSSGVDPLSAPSTATAMPAAAEAVPVADVHTSSVPSSSEPGASESTGTGSGTAPSFVVATSDTDAASAWASVPAASDGGALAAPSSESALGSSSDGPAMAASAPSAAVGEEKVTATIDSASAAVAASAAFAVTVSPAGLAVVKPSAGRGCCSVQ